MNVDSNNKPQMEQGATRPNDVAGFVRQVGKRLDRHHLWNVIFRTALVAGAVMLVIALIYVWPGYQVPTLWYAAVFGAAALIGLVSWLFGRTSDEQAAGFADKFFGLKDAVLSCFNFSKEGKVGGFYDLQSQQTNKMLAGKPVQKIPYQPPYRIVALAVVMLGVSVSLGFKGPSKAVVEKQQQAIATENMTETANQTLKDLVEELAAAVEDEQERKLLEPDKLRQWVDELEQTSDRQEALRQYARLELKLNRAAEMLSQRKDEKLLDTVAQELKKDRASKDLAEKLKQKKYEQAAKELRDMKTEALDPETLKKLSERRRQLAKLKAAAHRMADAVRSTNQAGKKQNGNSRNAKAGKSSDAKMGQSRNGKTNASNSESESTGDQSNSDQDELETMIEDLEDAIEELDEALEMAELQENDSDDQQDLDASDDCEECDQAVQDELDELADQLMKMARKRKARMKLRKLSQQASRAQSAGTVQTRSRQPGGKKAGKGSSDATRDQRDENINNDQYTKLKGIKGDGPSLTKIEAADDGTGTSNLTAEAKRREFKRQFESFVGREDVPEDLKNGVKNYFTNIHQPVESSGSDEDATSGSDSEDVSNQ